MDKRRGQFELFPDPPVPRPRFDPPRSISAQPQAPPRSSPDGAPLVSVRDPHRPPAPAEQDDDILSVADLDRRLKRVVENATEDVWVAGEVSSLKEVGSGHIYFTLKDESEEASIDAVMYRTAPARSRRVLSEGARVVLRGRASLYVPRGRLQFLADLAKPAGRGAILEALERLKHKLESEGLFDRDRKRPLPPDPRLIGVVTSADGAAIHDIITVAFRRGALRIVLARAPVQGPQAAPRMARAIALLAKLPGIEAIIVGRGGGSAEDLSAYNEEILVREVARSPVPIVSAVGHEVDVSLLDLVADARAATPSQAAEMLVPDREARAAELAHLVQRMRRAVDRHVQQARSVLARRAELLFRYRATIAEQQRELDDVRDRLRGAIAKRFARERAALVRSERALSLHDPRAVLVRQRNAVTEIMSHMRDVLLRRMFALRASFGRSVARLDALSPLAVLGRGYAIATTTSGAAVRSSREVQPGDILDLRFHEGAARASVVSIDLRSVPPKRSDSKGDV